MRCTLAEKCLKGTGLPRFSMKLSPAQPLYCVLAISFSVGQLELVWPFVNYIVVVIFTI